ncbi:MAG: prevent-host-death protein, partial [Lutibacter sp.]|nr:prevent-host-death protein [Lutibacter sp.]
SASIFNSQYKTDTDEWFNTRYNKNYLFNALIGKEYRVGTNKQNLLGFNVKLSIQGGDRYTIIDEATSIIEQDVIYNETTPFTAQTKTAVLTHFTVNYEWYKKKTSHKLSLKILNASNFKEFQGHRYNIKTNTVDEFREALIIPNISYKLSF